METVGAPWMWYAFIAFIVAMLVLDLLVLHRKPHAISVREALVWSVFWIGLALVFNLGVYQWFGPQKGLEFLTGYLIEKALSVDNIFVFLVIFGYFAVPASYQHRLLFWGVLGAIVMRVIFILAGAALLARFHWVIYVFGAFLVLTGIKILMQKGGHANPENTLIVRLFRRVVPVTDDYTGFQLIVRRGGRLFATPLMMVLFTIEATDVLFAVDSIPAIFAVTRDPFIVFTSNIFAILGLRSLFFLLAGIVEKFRFLKVGLGLVLAFVGVKMLISGFYKVPIGLSLVVITALIAGSVVLSLVIPEVETGNPAEDDVIPHGPPDTLEPHGAPPENPEPRPTRRV